MNPYLAKIKVNNFIVNKVKLINLNEGLSVRILDLTHKVFGDEVIILDFLLSEDV